MGNSKISNFNIYGKGENKIIVWKIIKKLIFLNFNINIFYWNNTIIIIIIIIIIIF